MNSSIQLFPDQGSAHAAQVDFLYFFLLFVAAFFTLLICCLILFFVARYRRQSTADRSRQGKVHLWLEMMWTVIPLLLTMVMFGWGARLYLDVHQSPPQAETVDVIGKQWMWKIRAEGGKAEINELHLPVGQSVRLRMISEDVIHSFYMPAFRVKMDVLPGQYSYLSFTPNRIGSYHLFCAEYCGTSHSKMIGQVIVMEPAAYANWLQGSQGNSADEIGRKLFEQFRCDSCHSGKEDAHGPRLAGIFGATVPLSSGQSIIADDEYLRESILNPGAHVTAGYRPIMPTYQGQLSEEDVLNIIAYLKTLTAPPSPKQREIAP